MAVQPGILGSSIAKKYWMALTGLFLIVFLIIHVAGNIQLLDLSPEGRLAFNEYTAFMVSSSIVGIVGYVLYLSILFHAIEGLWLTYQNRKARPAKYKNFRPGRNSNWASRQMGIMGTLILAFIILHMAQFWYTYKWGEIPIDSAGNRDMAEVVIATFTDGTWGLFMVIIYVIAQAAVAFHLWHGFESTFQSLGINSKKKKIWQVIGRSFAVVVSVLFAIIPVYIYLYA